MIYRTMLKSKIHRATVTDANVDYPGSITIDLDILKAADILEHEKVHVLGLSSGSRLETYAIEGPAGSGQVCVNGAAARLVSKGEKVIILSYAQVAEKAAADYKSTVVLLNEKNEVTALKEKGPAFNAC